MGYGLGKPLSVRYFRLHIAKGNSAAEPQMRTETILAHFFPTSALSVLQPHSFLSRFSTLPERESSHRSYLRFRFQRPGAHHQPATRLTLPSPLSSSEINSPPHPFTNPIHSAPAHKLRPWHSVTSHQYASKAPSLSVPSSVQSTPSPIPPPSSLPATPAASSSPIPSSSRPPSTLCT